MSNPEAFAALAAAAAAESAPAAAASEAPKEEEKEEEKEESDDDMVSTLYGFLINCVANFNILGLRSLRLSACVVPLLVLYLTLCIFVNTIYEFLLFLLISCCES